MVISLNSKEVLGRSERQSDGQWLLKIGWLKANLPSERQGT